MKVSGKLKEHFDNNQPSNEVIKSKLDTLKVLWINEKYIKQVEKILELSWDYKNNPEFVDAFDSLVNWVKLLNDKKHNLILSTIWWVADDYGKEEVA